MTWYNKVAWNQGMMIQPQHFQQNTRYLENLIMSRCADIAPFDWGVQTLKFDQALLRQGKIAIDTCVGRFPDGTPFEIKPGDALPAVLEVPEIQGETVYLALPLRRMGMAEISSEHITEGLMRYRLQEISVNDTIQGRSTSEVDIEVANLNLRLMLGNQNFTDYTTFSVARIIERQADGQIVLDDAFIPPCLSCQASIRIIRIIEELQSLLGHRANALAQRISDGVQGGANTSEIADFLFLQTLNRYEPILAHFAGIKNIHPESLYRLLLQIAGELTTFTKQDRRPSRYPTYLHQDLNQTLSPILDELRAALATVLEHSAIQLPVQQKKFGIHIAPINDRTLIKQAYFILAVKAANPADELRRHFPQQAKIGPVEKIRDLVNLQLPGIAFSPMAAAPRQIPYHSGFTYFELEKSGDLWEQLSQSGGFAFHVGGEFDHLELEFWAIKE